MDCSSQSGLGRAALIDSFEYTHQVALPVGFVDIVHGGQRFVVGQDGLEGRKAHEATLKSVIWNLVLIVEELSEALSVRRERLWFHGLRDPFMQPLDAATARQLVDE